MPNVVLIKKDADSVNLVRLRLITHNARLVDARKDRGMTGEDMAQAAGLRRYRLRDIENLRAIPTEDEVIKISCILVKPTDYLFPEELLSAIKAGVFSRRKVELTAPEVISLTEAQHLKLITDGGLDAVEEEMDRKLLRERINEVIGTLHPRERRVLQLRFGLEDGRSRTLEEVCREFGVTRERIRQIEDKAMRKLRHPSRSRKLQGF